MEKYCTKCKQTKLLTEYYVSYPIDRKSAKISSYCRKCECEIKRVKERKTYIKNCLYCSKEFVSYRIDATCCNESHRNMYSKKEKNGALKDKLNRISWKIKCKDNYKTPLTKRDYKYIYNLDLTAREVFKKIKRPFTTIYTLRSLYRQSDEYLERKESLASCKKIYTKQEKMQHYNKEIQKIFKNASIECSFA